MAEKLLHFAGDCKLFLFYAEMGVGKTTFIKALCKCLGSADNFSSPSFSIINEYHCPTGKIYHFDLYRIKNIEELYNLGIEEYLDSGAYCFVEWPELMHNIIRNTFIKVSITISEDSRYIRALKS